MRRRWHAVDLFAGCGGLSQGLIDGGIRVLASVEIDNLAIETYRSNHPDIPVIAKDIRKVTAKDLSSLGTIDIIAGCPPCQGFSRVRRRNRARSVADDRNALIDDFLRLVRGIKPKVVFLENVPGIEKYVRFRAFIGALEKLGYIVNSDCLDMANFGVPQRRRRVVVLAGLGFDIPLPPPAEKQLTVRDALKSLSKAYVSKSPLHNYRTKHGPKMIARIEATPPNGGSRKDWPKKLQLACHQRTNGFKDVYGRMNWERPAPTITGGCINPSRGRFLHPTEHRAITLREAALLQSFPINYHFSLSNGRYPAALMIGNAVPPEFSRRVALSIKAALKNYSNG